MLRSFLIAALVLAFAGCDSVPQSRYPPTDPNHVKVFLRWPKAPFEKLGEINFVGTYYPDKSRASMMDPGGSEATAALRAKAAALGADAIVMTGETVTDPNSLDTGENSKIWLTGMAIRFTTH